MTSMPARIASRATIRARRSQAPAGNRSPDRRLSTCAARPAGLPLRFSNQFLERLDPSIGKRGNHTNRAKSGGGYLQSREQQGSAAFAQSEDTHAIDR